VTEQRRIPRIQPFVAPCRVVFEGRVLTGYLTDLSEAGARITSDTEPPPAHAPVTLELRVGRVPARSRLSAKVAWVKKEDVGATFGLSFADLPAEQQKALETVVAEFKRLADEIAS
jgi:hypothetical protein